MPYKDPIKAKACKKAYYQKNKEEQKARERVNRKKDTRKRHRNEYAKKWRAANADKSREYVKRYKEKYPDKMAEYNDRPEVKSRKLKHGQEIYKRNQEYIQRVKAASGCKYCPESDPICLDFHHRYPNEKEALVSKILGWSMPRVKREIAKCDVVCSNCHRKLHRDDRKGWWKNREKKDANGSTSHQAIAEGGNHP